VAACDRYGMRCAILGSFFDPKAWAKAVASAEKLPLRIQAFAVAATLNPCRRPGPASGDEQTPRCLARHAQ
jgi:hypothetical protein